MKFMASLIVACVACLVTFSTSTTADKNKEPVFNHIFSKSKTAATREYFNHAAGPLKEQMEMARKLQLQQQQQKDVTLEAGNPTYVPTPAPSYTPSNAPTYKPSNPTYAPTYKPSNPSYAPSAYPTNPTYAPSAYPTNPTGAPSVHPTHAPYVLLTYGFLNFIQGTTTGCTPVTGVVRVQLGVCARVAGTATPSYAWNYVKSTATSAVWYQDTFTDALCATPAKSSTPMVTLTRTGCQKVKVNGALNHLTDGAYATVTLDYEYDAVPAASSLPASWVYTATWANNKACADPAHNYPTLLVASPLPPSATCPPTVSCGTAGPSGPASVYGTTFDSGCSTVTPQDTGYMTLTQWTGPKCSGQIANVSYVVSLGQCMESTALPDFSPEGVTTGYYKFKAITQTGKVSHALQITEYSDDKCTMSVATEILVSFNFNGCYGTFLVTNFPASTTNPCFYLRQVGLISSSTVKPMLPLIPGIWNVTSSYMTAAGCSDKTRKTNPLYCRALLGTDPNQNCDRGQPCMAIQDPLGNSLGQTCLNVKASPSSVPTTMMPTKKPIKKTKVAAAVEAVGAALGLRGAAV